MPHAHLYLDYERTLLDRLKGEFIALPEGSIEKEYIRLKTLRLRCRARDLWIEAGNRVPKRIKFSDGR